MKEYRCRKCLYYFYSENGIPYCPACDCESIIKVEEDVIELESHHIHPRFMGNKEGKGQQYDIPKKKHDILHGKIINWLWEEVEDCCRKDIAIKNIITKSKKFLGV